MRPTRRTFLLSSAAGTAALCGYSRSAARPEPSERLRVGAVGVAGQGFGALRSIATGGAEIVALCDVDTRRQQVVDQRAFFKNARFLTDFRRMIDAGGLDAVMVAT